MSDYKGTNRESFQRKICDDPFADDNRLVYADWLEEQGDPLAELIRIEIAMALIPKEELHFGDPLPCYLHPNYEAMIEENSPGVCEYCKLFHRANDLRWVQSADPSVQVVAGVVAKLPLRSVPPTPPPISPIVTERRRGFPYRITITNPDYWWGSICPQCHGDPTYFERYVDPLSVHSVDLIQSVATAAAAELKRRPCTMCGGEGRVDATLSDGSRIPVLSRLLIGEWGWPIEEILVTHRMSLYSHGIGIDRSGDIPADHIPHIVPRRQTIVDEGPRIPRVASAARTALGDEISGEGSLQKAIALDMLNWARAKYGFKLIRVRDGKRWVDESTHDYSKFPRQVVVWYRGVATFGDERARSAGSFTGVEDEDEEAYPIGSPLLQQLPPRPFNRQQERVALPPPREHDARALLGLLWPDLPFNHQQRQVIESERVVLTDEFDNPTGEIAGDSSNDPVV